MNKFGYGMCAIAVALSMFVHGDQSGPSMAEYIADQELLDQLADVQEVVDAGTTAGTEEDWVHDRGMLGLGLFGSFVATVIGYHLFAIFVLGSIYQIREKKRWRWPINSRFWLEWGRATGIYNKTLVGIATPRAFTDFSDGKYLKLTEEQHERALLETRTAMKMLGITYSEAYVRRLFDCEDFAFVFKGIYAFCASRIIKEECAKSGDPLPDAGVPVALLGYKRDGKYPHVDLEFELKTGLRHSQPYPDHENEPVIDEEERDTKDLYLR